MIGLLALRVEKEDAYKKQEEEEEKERGKKRPKREPLFQSVGAIVEPSPLKPVGQWLAYDKRWVEVLFFILYN